MEPGRIKICKIVSAILVIIILFSIFLAYSQYLTLKKIFIDRISHKVRSLTGQGVKIGDLSFSLPEGINIHDVTIENPEGFEEGQLLKVKRVLLQVNYRELLRGIISLKTVEIAAPELTLMKDKNNRLNVSDTLRALLSKKGTTKYRIESLKIGSGVFDMNKDQRYHNGDIVVTLRNLSSDPGTKTLIEASASSHGKSRISVKGWAYLNDYPKKINLSALWENIRLSLFEELAGKGMADAEEAEKVDISLHAEGDTKKGIALKSRIRLKRAWFILPEKEIKDITLDADAFLNIIDDSLIINNAVLNAGDVSTVRLTGVVKDISRDPSYSAKVQISVSDLSAFNPVEGLKVGGILTSDTISIKGKLDEALPALSGALQLRNGSLKYGSIYAESINTRITFDGTADSVDSLHGSISVRARNLSVVRVEGNKTVVKNATLDADITFRGKDIDVKTDARAGKIAATLSGTVNGFTGEGRSARIRVVLPETGIADIRSTFWDIFPDKLLYAGLDGSFSADISVGYSKSGLSAEGELRMKNLMLEGENGEYSIGPVNGKVPVHFNKADNGEEPLSLPSFERPEFKELSEYYAKKRQEEGLSKITIGSLRYGFKLLENIEVWMNQKGRHLNISRFDANIFGGKLSGSAVADIFDGLNYRVGILVKGISLARLCEDIAPIKGYITGKVDGIAVLKSSGAGIGGLIGRADLWTYSAGSEKTKISREFLQKIGGPSVKAYLGERPFDKGIVSLYIQNGFLIFNELEISHKNLLGITDLSVKVAPFHNRIALDHLMSTIAEAAARAKEK